MDIKNQEEFLEVYGAKVHNLKNINLKIPRNKFVVITGLSGSGKSSLAFDTIFAEGQRRFLNTLGGYVRRIIGDTEKPDVDKIEGLSPVISIEQKTVNKNPRSTVGTTTEIYDFLRLLYARIGEAYSYNTGEKMVKYTENVIIDNIKTIYKDKKIAIIAPVVKGRKGHYKELLNKIRHKGFIRVRIDGKIIDLIEEIRLDRYKIHDIEIVIDRLRISEENEERLLNGIKNAFIHGDNVLGIINIEESTNDEEVTLFSKNLMCAKSGLSYHDPEPNLFSFNSPYGSCPKCNGLSTILEIDLNKLIPDYSKSLYQGGVEFIGAYKDNVIFNQLEVIFEEYNESLKTKISDLNDELINVIIYGTNKRYRYKKQIDFNDSFVYEGVINLIDRYKDFENHKIKKFTHQFLNRIECNECYGTRLNKIALHYKLNDKNIAQISKMSISELQIFISGLQAFINEKQKLISTDLIKEIEKRINFLIEVGLSYLSLDRNTNSLSGGESQRIRLATQIGTQLTDVLYILDEPSIGLHQRDNYRLINSLKNLRDIGNSVIVVEHDKDIMLESDFLIDIGPLSGKNGGEVIFAEETKNIYNCKSSTIDYLTNRKKIEIPKRRKLSKKYLELIGANGNNLKNVNLKIPLGNMICITGVSGSGKSTLIDHTLYPILNNYFYNGTKKPLEYKEIKGVKHIDKIVEIDQKPIGRTPRSNPATYTDVFTEIRSLFAEMTEARIRGFQAGSFSFNVKGGRCEECKGAGMKEIEMNFLPNVTVECDVCKGMRYNREILLVKYNNKNINDVLNMTIENACDFFANIPKIIHKLNTLKSVGLGYLTLGQSSTTLSGGEAQRVKLASELYKKATGNTLYILDEPTTGLHFDDIKQLLTVLDSLVDNGNTVLIIEHNMDIIKYCDYIIDLGPDGGNNGGEVIATGRPEDIIKNELSYTGKYLKKELFI